MGNPHTMTAQQQYEIDLQADKELTTVIKRCNKLMSERGKRGGGAKALRNVITIELLKREHLDVLNDLTISNSSSKKAEDEKTYAELEKLLQACKMNTTLIKQKKTFLKEMDDSIKKEKNKIFVISHKVPSNVQWQQRVERAAKTLETLENKLDTVVKQYGTIMAENYRLRSEVAHTEIERMNFNKLWFTLVSNLNRGKKILMDILEQATIAYNNRKECIIRLNTLRTLATSDLERNKQEMESLQKQLDNDRQMESFLMSKHQYRNMRDLTNKKNQRRLMYRMSVEGQLQEYKELLKKIEAFVGVQCDPNTTQFIIQFKTDEIENMSCFNYVNDLNYIIEDTNDELSGLRTEIEKHKQLMKARKEQQDNALTVLKNDLKEITKEVTTSENNLNVVNKTLAQLYVNIDKLFKLCKCTNGPFVQLLGENDKITDYNVLLYLKVLEDEVSNYMASVYYKEKVEVSVAKKGAKPVVTIIDDKMKPLHKHQVEDFVPTSPCPLCVDREIVTDVIDSLQIIEEREEVSARLAERLKLPDGLDRLHNVSNCNLPKSRQIIQRRYQ